MYLEMPFIVLCFIIENEILTCSFSRFSSADVGPFPHPDPVPSTYYIPVELRSVRLTKNKRLSNRGYRKKKKKHMNLEETQTMANGDVA